MTSNWPKKLIILLLLLSFFPNLALKALPERTGPGCVPCDPETDFEEIFLVKSWKNLPHKNQEESQERVDEVNSMIKKGKWSYVKMLPVLACLSFAASTVADWWAMEYGLPLGTYRNFYNGSQEKGFNPRELEVVYLTRSKKDYFKYPIVPVPDLVHKKPFPASNRGYARVLTNQFEGTIKDPILNQNSYSFSRDKYPIESKWLNFKRKLKSNDKFTKELIRVIHSHGPMLAHLEYSRFIKNILPAVHGIVIIGYGKPRSSPEDTVFIIHDSYGDHPKDYGIRAEGGPSYKYVKAKYLQSALVFPHKPLIEINKMENLLSLRVLNKAKKPLNVFKLAVWNENTEEAIEIHADENGSYKINPEEYLQNNSDYLRVYVAAEYYMETPDKGHWFQLKL